MKGLIYGGFDNGLKHPNSYLRIYYPTILRVFKKIKITYMALLKISIYKLNLLLINYILFISNFSYKLIF